MLQSITRLRDPSITRFNEDKSARYHRLKRRAALVSLGWTVALLAVLQASGYSVKLRALAESAAAPLPSGALVRAASITIYVLLLAVLTEVGSSPAAFYSGFLLERRYGLSTER